MTITTKDGASLRVGDLAYNYYDCKWGKIEEIRENGWCILRHEDGSAAFLNGERLANKQPNR